jgi:aquaporin Z
LQNAVTKLSGNKKKFFAELIGTFFVVVCATGSVVINAQYGGTVGLWFEAFAPFAAVSAMVFLFAKTSMAHFNPAVTIAFLITKHMPARLLLVYLGAEFIGAFLASVFVKYVIGNDANLGANTPNYSFPIPLIVGVEILVTAILMAMILVVVHTKGLKGFGSIAIGSMIFFDIFIFSFISGASMNPIRSLAPAILSGSVGDLWLYWTAPFAGSAIAALLYKKISKRR